MTLSQRTLHSSSCFTDKNTFFMTFTLKNLHLEKDNVFETESLTNAVVITSRHLLPLLFFVVIPQKRSSTDLEEASKRLENSKSVKGKNVHDSCVVLVSFLDFVLVFSHLLPDFTKLRILFSLLFFSCKKNKSAEGIFSLMFILTSYSLLILTIDQKGLLFPQDYD